MSVTAEALSVDSFDEQVFNDSVANIQVCNDNTLIYQFKDGSETTLQWRDKSRSQSWTDEMRAEARRKALERRQAQCQK